MKHRPATLLNIFYRVGDQIAMLREICEWPFQGWSPSKRTTDRRVNEAADPRFYENGVPKIVAVTAGVYCPNVPEIVKAVTRRC